MIKCHRATKGSPSSPSGQEELLQQPMTVVSFQMVVFDSKTCLPAFQLAMKTDKKYGEMRDRIFGIKLGALWLHDIALIPRYHKDTGVDLS